MCVCLCEYTFYNKRRLILIRKVKTLTCRDEGNGSLINPVAPLRNSGFVPLTASIPLPCYVVRIHYNQHLLVHVVDMPYINNSWSPKEIKDKIRNIQRRLCHRPGLSISKLCHMSDDVITR